MAKAYRLLHAILDTAADDRIIHRNPCRIDKAGKVKACTSANAPGSLWHPVRH